MDVFYFLLFGLDDRCSHSKSTPHHKWHFPRKRDFNTTKHGRLEEAIFEGGEYLFVFKSDIHSFILAYNEKGVELKFGLSFLSSLPSLLFSLFSFDWLAYTIGSKSLSLSLPLETHSAPCVFCGQSNNPHTHVSLSLSLTLKKREREQFRGG